MYIANVCVHVQYNMGSVMEQEASLYQMLLQNISSEEENVIVVGDFFYLNHSNNGNPRAFSFLYKPLYMLFVCFGKGFSYIIFIYHLQKCCQIMHIQLYMYAVYRSIIM